MDIRVTPTGLDGALLVEPDVAKDDRGFFLETYHRRRFAEHGIDCEFVQDNHSRSGAGVLRGIHCQDMRAPMAKLVRCTAGRIFDVIVDLRVGSPTFGQWSGTELTAENMRQVFVPIGFGHAFLTLSDAAEFQYKCSNYYEPAAEIAIAWDDPELGIDWPFDSIEARDQAPGSAQSGASRVVPILSRRDREGMSLAQYLANPAFKYHR